MWQIFFIFFLNFLYCLVNIYCALEVRVVGGDVIMWIRCYFSSFLDDTRAHESIECMRWAWYQPRHQARFFKFFLGLISVSTFTLALSSKIHSPETWDWYASSSVPYTSISAYQPHIIISLTLRTCFWSSSFAHTNLRPETDKHTASSNSLAHFLLRLISGSPHTLYWWRHTRLPPWLCTWYMCRNWWCMRDVSGRLDVQRASYYVQRGIVTLYSIAMLQ